MVLRPMEHGVLRLSSGLAARCDYEFTTRTSGELELPSALYLPRRDHDSGTLTLSGGAMRPVEVEFGASVGHAWFVCSD
jgi:hypothetical protein